MTQALKVEKKSAHERAIIEILGAAIALKADKAQAAGIFQSAGIITDESLSLVALSDAAENCLNSLMGRLSPLPDVKISARCILWNRGLGRGKSAVVLSLPQSQTRISWLARRSA